MPNQEFLPEEFDEWAATYDENVSVDAGFPFDGYSRVLQAVLHSVQMTPGDAVLDLGTGTGNLAALLAGQGARVWGVDFSGEMLAIARAKLPGAAFAQADVRGPWPETFQRRYQAIVSAYTFHHFPLDEKVAILSRLRAENLAVGGCIVVADLSFEDAAAQDALKQRLGDEWEEEYFWLADEALAALRAAGLDAVYIQVSSCAGVYRIE